MRVALAAAGTGGHVYPALAVADALRARGVDRDDIVFFGGDRMEADAVPGAGYPFVPVEIRGLRRSLSPANLALPLVVWRAMRRMESEFRTREVDAVGVFGGYVSVPAAMAARRAGIGFVVHEQNARPGLANRLIARRAAETLVAFPAARSRLKSGRVVGNPLRPAIARFDRSELRAEARKRYGLPDGRPVLGVLGGSLGASILNEQAARIAGDADADAMALLHLTGRAHADSVTPTADRSPLCWVVVGYEPEMETFYAAVDVVLARAGALTVSELAATGTPSVLVPLEATHQGENAAVLADAGAATVVPQDEIDRVPVEVQQLVHDAARRDAMGRAAAALAAPAAAGEVAAALVEVARG